MSFYFSLSLRDSSILNSRLTIKPHFDFFDPRGEILVLMQVLDEEDELHKEDPLFEDLPLDSVVKIFSVLTEPNYCSPWQVEESEECTGSGFILENRKIMTNAHVVQCATMIWIRAHGQAEKYEATVVSINYDCDLATLHVDDDFWQQDGVELQALTLDPQVPFLQNEVVVAGYPMGGDSLSLTKGIISRIEDAPYSDHGDISLLNLQIDAAVNAGNSGGPVFRGNRVIGVAFSGIDDADNIGYVIPTLVIRHFLQNGFFCGLGIWTQSLENVCMRERYGMKQKQTGVLLRAVEPLSPCRGIIERGDVLLAINGCSISNDGTYKWRKRERLSLSFIIRMSLPGDVLKLDVLRKGKHMQLEAGVKPLPPLVLPTPPSDPKYVCWSGLVFVVLSISFMNDWTMGEDHWENAPANLVRLCTPGVHSVRKFEGEEVVVLSRILSHKINQSYEDLEGSIAQKVNGVRIRNLKHLLEMMEATDSADYVEIEFDDFDTVVIRKDKGDEATKAILDIHRIPNITNIKN